VFRLWQPTSLEFRSFAMLNRLLGRASSFRNKCVVITGATAGVGRAVAERFAKEGAWLGLIARDAQALEETKRELIEMGAPVVTFAADVSDAGAVFEAARRVERELGPIDVWVNAAMVTVFSPISKMTPDEFRRVTEVTYLGFVHGTLAALEHMRPRNRGNIVQIGSALAYRGIPLQSAYCAAKFAIRGFTESLRTELEHENSNIRVSMVQLPGINTPQFDWARAHIEHHPRPVAPVFDPSVPAEAVLKAAREGGDEYWLGRTVATLILGNMWFPEWIARYLANTAVSGQQTKERISPDRPDNLFEPVHAYHRTRGSFGKDAQSWAPALPAQTTRLAVLAAGTVATIGIGYLLGRAAAPRRRVLPRRSERALPKRAA
jgi:NAD(P)-dependent dehydrogenase (short-subunit alcohol dehydrogenase family)